MRLLMLFYMFLLSCSNPSSTASISSSSAKADPISSSSSTWILTPVPLSLMDSEMVNPLRGQYLWNGQGAYPEHWPAIDDYQRYNWVEIEPVRGQIRWELIDSKIAEAKLRGGRFGLRIMALCQDWSPHIYKGAHSAMPDDLADSVNVLFGHAPSDTVLYAIPDWNHPHYWLRLRELLTAIAERYRDNPNFAYVDVSSYGNWGEFHLYPFDRPGGAYDSSKQRPLSDSAKRALVRMNAEIFQGKILLLNLENKASVAEMLNQKGVITGFRSDCLGSDNLAGGENALLSVAAAREHWRVGPMVSEWCQRNLGTSGSNLFGQGLEQVRKYHFSMLSSHNFDKAPTSAQEIRDFRMANVISGYRLRPDTVRVERSGNRWVIAAHFVNDNIAPTYLTWKMQWLIGASEFESKADLRTVMPDSSRWFVDTLDELDWTASPSLAMRIDDAQGVAAPMFLAIPGRQPLGHYHLGVLQ